jgi:osmotically-inducible protein OsmY
MNKLFKITAAAALVMASALTLGACAETKTQESTGAYMDDSVITSKVKTAILQDPALKVLQIQVTTYKNVVQLSGFVDSSQMVAKAGTVARQVEGVTAVKNDLLVK